MMKKILGKKGVIVSIIILFLSVNLVSAIEKNISEIDQQSNILGTKTNNTKETVSITVSISRNTRMNKQTIITSLDDVHRISAFFRELKNSMASDPFSQHTQHLKQEFITLLAEHKFIPPDIPADQYHTILNPPWFEKLQKNHNVLSHIPRNPSTEISNAAAFACSIGGEGIGILFPFIMIPRPRIITTWSALDGGTMAGKLLSIGGFIASGSQFGLALGFWGIGLAFATPYGTYYGFIGYALFASVTAEYIERYPPDYPPEIIGVEPDDGGLNVPMSLAELQFSIEDPNGDLMSYTVTTEPDIGSDSGSLKPAGTYTVPVHGVEASTEYKWTLSVSDDVQTIERTFTFTTEFIAPVISNPMPKHNAQYVPIWRSNLSFDLKDYQGDLMNWSVETQPDIGSGSGTGVGDGRYTVAISGLENYTRYIWFVNATDGTNWARRTYVFTTAPEGIVLLEPIADTSVHEHSPNNNYGNEGRMLVSDKYGASSDYDARGMVLFDLSEIPAGSTIISANLSLYYYRYDDTDPVGREITCHRILEDWDEMIVTYNTMPDSDSVECSSTVLPGYFTWVDWDVTSEVDDFINNGDDNYGWMIRDYKDPWGTYDIPQQYYYSREAVDLHPSLFIGYDLP